MCQEGDTLTVHSLESRFDQDLPVDEHGFKLVRDLPEPAGEGRYSRTFFHRSWVAGIRALRRDRALIPSYDIAHIHTYNMFTDWGALPLLRRKGVKLVLWVHNVHPHYHRGPDKLERWMHGAGYRAVDHLIVAHEHLKEQLVDDFGVKQERVSVMPFLVPQVEERTVPPSDSRTFLFFGTLRPNKGIDVLLDALATLPENLDAEFVFAGRGDRDLEERVEAFAEQRPHVSAEIGWITEERKIELFNHARAVLLPYTRFDAQSGVLTDAHATGTPIIASDVGALGGEVRATDSGILIEPGNTSSLADAIVTMASDEKIVRELSQNAIQVSKVRSPERSGKALRNLYDLIGAGI